jgi:hypothetical protein
LLVIGVLGVGGFGTAAASIRLGHARLVAGIALAVLAANGIVAAILLGVGVAPIFSEGSLRRYPLSCAARLIARHTTALLQPFWLLLLAISVGLAAGFVILAVGRLPFAIPAALLFVVTTYLAGCVVTSLGTWMLTGRGGSLVGVGLAATALLLIPIAPELLKWAATHPDLLSWARLPMALTPPAAAARAMTSRMFWPAFGANMLLLVWMFGLSILLTLTDRLPRRSAGATSAARRWTHPIDRVAAAFGPSTAPLAAKTLRYYLRSPQVRLNYPVALPLVAAMAMNAGASPDSKFLLVLGAAPVIAFLATGSLPLNLFGFDGAGFSRHFLLPLSGDRILRTTALASLVPGALLVPVGVGVWWLLMPDPTARMTVMLLAAGYGGLLFFHALAIWTSLLAPTPIPLDLVFGNRLSVAANVLMVGSIVAFFGFSVLLNRVGIHRVMDRWWMAVPLFVAAVVLFTVTLRVGARVLVSRREEILAELEGQ